MSEFTANAIIAYISIRYAHASRIDFGSVASGGWASRSPTMVTREDILEEIWTTSNTASASEAWTFIGHPSPHPRKFAAHGRNGLIVLLLVGRCLELGD